MPRIDASTMELLIEDVGGPGRAARLLGVHRTTVSRWLARQVAMPQASYRALYAASKWGRSDRAIWSINARTMAGQTVASQAAKIDALEKQIGQLLRLADFGCANAPLYRMVRS